MPKPRKPVEPMLTVCLKPDSPRSKHVDSQTLLVVTKEPVTVPAKLVGHNTCLQLDVLVTDPALADQATAEPEVCPPPSPEPVAESAPAPAPAAAAAQEEQPNG